MQHSPPFDPRDVPFRISGSHTGWTVVRAWHRKSRLESKGLRGLLMLLFQMKYDRQRWMGGLLIWLGAWIVHATPANKAALERHFETFLSAKLARCTTCHLPSDNKLPESLQEFPHNPFGARLRQASSDESIGRDLARRILAVAREDSDGDGVDNESELLLGTNPGDSADVPRPVDPATIAARRAEFTAFQSRYRWQPFSPVARPPIPASGGSVGSSNPVDAFLEAERREKGLQPRPPAPKEILLRRVHLDLIGLNPTPEEQRDFMADLRPDAYERLVDRLLADPRHGERWARHWMDVWRYSDWAGWVDGNQIRDSQPHIWRWRDWIVDSINADKPYDRMVVEMLAADEAAPADTDALRATGFLVRNYKMLSREQWMEDTVKHTSQAFLGLTVGCAKCHDHMVDPISQREYYSMRAIFEPHQVRIDRVPGELNTAVSGLARAYDATNAPTYFLVRGDERHPLTNEVIRPGVPAVLGGRYEVAETALPEAAWAPDDREFVIRETLEASEKSVAEARERLAKGLNETNRSAGLIRGAELGLDLAHKKHAALLAVLASEKEQGPGPLSTNAVLLQRVAEVAVAKHKLHEAEIALQSGPTNKLAELQKKVAEAVGIHQAAVDVLARPTDAVVRPRSISRFKNTSTGRRLALAKWMTDSRNPLTARVAVNHVWIHHFGRGLAPTPADFGRNGRPPSHPQLLDWLAAEFVSPSLPGSNPAEQRPWSFKRLNRLIVTSAAYRMSSTADPENLARDPDNIWLWRMNSGRLEAEAVRDNILHASGSLDPLRGGPEIDHKAALTSTRRSIYLRQAAERQAEFLQIFDGPAVTECYQRHPSVLPQQALALGNSELSVRESRQLAERLLHEPNLTDAQLVESAFRRVLGRAPQGDESRVCMELLTQGKGEAGSRTGTGIGTGTGTGTGAGERDSQFARTLSQLILVLFNHSDFVTSR